MAKKKDIAELALFDSFSTDQQSDLTKTGLSPPAIKDLEDLLREQAWVHSPAMKRPSAEKRKAELKSLLNSLEAVKLGLETVSHYTYHENPLLMACRTSLEPHLLPAIDVIGNLVAAREAAGNVSKELDGLVYHVARVLLRHDFKIKRQGHNFLRVIEIAFDCVKADRKSIDRAVERAWASDGDNAGISGKWRPRSIEDLIRLYSTFGNSFEDQLAELPPED